jgi:hypothetical protein
MGKNLMLLKLILLLFVLFSFTETNPHTSGPSAGSTSMSNPFD